MINDSIPTVAVDLSEWNLSDKMILGGEIIKYESYLEADVREFIRRLKEAFDKPMGTLLIHDKIIDKLAGEKLIEKPKAEDDELLKEALKDIEKINKWAKEKLLKKEKKLR